MKFNLYHIWCTDFNNSLPRTLRQTSLTSWMLSRR